MSVRLRKSALAAAALVSLCSVASAANAASVRPLTIPGYDRAARGVGLGHDPGPFHVAPDPYERNSDVGYYQSLIAQSRVRPMPQRISGTCAEACTMRLGIRGACVDRNAELWFLPALSPGGTVLPARTRTMFSAYPGAIGHWAVRATNARATFDPIRGPTSVFDTFYGLDEYGSARGPNFAVLSGAQAIALGARGCS